MKNFDNWDHVFRREKEYLGILIEKKLAVDLKLMLQSFKQQKAERARDLKIMEAYRTQSKADGKHIAVYL